MKENSIAKFQISDTFNITSKGILFTGFVLDGTISLGNYIEFNFLDKILRRKIIGIGGVSSHQLSKINTSLLVESTNEKEIEELKNWNPKNTITLIYLKND